MPQLQGNSGATEFTEPIDWFYLSQNRNPAAIRILEQNIDKIEWAPLSINQNAPALQIMEPQKQIDECGLARTIDAFEANEISWVH